MSSMERFFGFHLHQPVGRLVGLLIPFSALCAGTHRNLASKPIIFSALNPVAYVIRLYRADSQLFPGGHALHLASTFIAF